MKFKGTHGPWLVDKITDSKKGLSVNCWIKNTQGKDIGYTTKEETVYNAKLIVAAPEMISMLIELQEKLTYGDPIDIQKLNRIITRAIG